MPKGISQALEDLRSLPTDADIRGWVVRLGLAMNAIQKDQEYDRYQLTASEAPNVTSMEVYEEQLADYQLAIDALTVLLIDDEQEETPA